jgi:hypothetical protein
VLQSVTFQLSDEIPYLLASAQLAFEPRSLPHIKEAKCRVSRSLFDCDNSFCRTHSKSQVQLDPSDRLPAQFLPTGGGHASEHEMLATQHSHGTHSHAHDFHSGKSDWGKSAALG